MSAEWHPPFQFELDLTTAEWFCAVGTISGISDG